MRQANVQGSENVASLAYKLGVGRFLSEHCLGLGERLPQHSPEAGGVQITFLCACARSVMSRVFQSVRLEPMEFM